MDMIEREEEEGEGESEGADQDEQTPPTDQQLTSDAMNKGE